MTTAVSQASSPFRRTRLSRTALFENIAGYLFISPWIVGFLAFEFGPLIAAGYLGLTRYDILTPPNFVGLANYDKMFTRDPLFWKSLWVTAIYSLSTVFLGVIFGVALAVLLNQKVRGMSLYRTIYYLPAVVSGVAVAYMWIWVFTPEAGIVNYALSLIGITGPNWLFSTTWTLPAFVAMSLWAVGGGMVLYLAGLQGVPTQLYEAASLDGAGRWASFLERYPSHDFPRHLLQLHHWNHWLVPGLYQQLCDHKWRTRKLNPLLCALPLPPRLRKLQDGIRRRPGHDPVYCNHDANRHLVPPIEPSRIL